MKIEILVYNMSLHHLVYINSILTNSFTIVMIHYFEISGFIKI